MINCSIPEEVAVAMFLDMSENVDGGCWFCCSAAVRAILAAIPELKPAAEKAYKQIDWDRWDKRQ